MSLTGEAGVGAGLKVKYNGKALKDSVEFTLKGTFGTFSGEIDSQNGFSSNFYQGLFGSYDFTIPGTNYHFSGSKGFYREGPVGLWLPEEDLIRNQAWSSPPTNNFRGLELSAKILGGLTFRYGETDSCE